MGQKRNGYVEFYFRHSLCLKETFKFAILCDLHMKNLSTKVSFDRKNTVMIWCGKHVTHLPFSTLNSCPTTLVNLVSTHDATTALVSLLTRLLMLLLNFFATGTAI